MTPELEALARRAVACRAWRWMPGMLRLRDAPGKADHLRREGRVEFHPDWSYSDWPCIPDLRDPATLGCLLALVREAWGDPCATSRAYCGYWGVLRPDVDPDCWHIARGATEAEALVSALERAP